MGADGPLDGAVTDLEAVLPALKRRGCNLLITGQVNPTVSMAASRRMFGEAGADRRRVVGLTRQAARSPAGWLPRRIEPDDAAVELVELAESGRLAPDDGDPATRIEPVSADFRGAIDAVATPDPEPGQLRVGLYSLTPLIGRFDREAVLAFVEEVTDAVADSRGMGHYHLPRPDEAPVVDYLDPQFDVRVELRQLPAADPTPEQRWHLDGETTGWIEL